MTDRILIEIATTEGPATVRAADYDPGARLSSMVLYDQNHVPVGVDAHFDAFDRKLRKHLAKLGYATPEGGLILEVDRPIDAGSSWQLGLALTHAVAARGLLTTSDRDATRVIWVTGAVGTSAWTAKGVEAVPRKLARASARLKAFAARGVQVDVLVPLDNLAEAVNAAPEEASLRPASDLGALLGGVLPGAAAHASTADRPRRRRLIPLVGGGLVAALGLGAVAMLVPDPGRWLGGTPDDAVDATAGSGAGPDAGPGAGAAGLDRARDGRAGDDRAEAAFAAWHAACLELLAPLAPAERFDPAGFQALTGFYQLLNTPEEALKPFAERIPPEAVEQTCGNEPEGAADIAGAAEKLDEVLTRRALYELASGARSSATERLSGLASPDGDAVFAMALAARQAAREPLLAEAAAKGQPLAEIADALLIAVRQGGAAPAALDRLRAAAARPGSGGLANGLLAALRFVAAELPPDGNPAARSEADAALLEGVMRLAAARAEGFQFPVEGTQLNHISARAPGMLGLALSDLTADEAAKLGPRAPEAGAVVTAVGASTPGLAPGDVILAVGRRAVTARADAEKALFAAISTAVRNGGRVDLTVLRAADGAERPLEIAVPERLAAVPLPQQVP